MEFQDQKPIYRQIADFILDNVLTKVLKPGDRIQSVRDMAKEVEVNPNTVARTYSFLNDEGIIENKRGVGYFIGEEAFAKTRSLKRTEFIREQLPVFYHNMQLLDISIEELQQLFEDLPEQTIPVNVQKD